MNTKAHKIRLNPTAEQAQYFLRAAGVARFAWNWGLSEYKRLKADRQKVDWNQIMKDFRVRLTLSERTWTCMDCGTVHDRDKNASVNIELEGTRLLAGSGYVRVPPVDGEALALASARTKLHPVETDSNL